jgi:hypothetical protein
MKCDLCGVKRLVKSKQILVCNYCKNWFCYPNCTDKHLGRCEKDPHPLYEEGKK